MQHKHSVKCCYRVVGEVTLMSLAMYKDIVCTTSAEHIFLQCVIMLYEHCSKCFSDIAFNVAERYSWQCLKTTL
jgi:hypothetical protein